MKNKIVGIIVIAFALIIGLVIWSFNSALTNIVNTSCSHGPSCPMWGTINVQTNISIGLMVFVLLIGLYLIFFGQERVEIIKKIREKVKVSEKIKNYDKVLKTLSSEEKKLVQILIDSQGAIFQSDLVEKSGFDKVKVSRILDRLEGNQLIERRRRGMTNIVILK
jgi:uncharacterized membrane protein